MISTFRCQGRTIKGARSGSVKAAWIPGAQKERSRVKSLGTGQGWQTAWVIQKAGSDFEFEGQRVQGRRGEGLRELSGWGRLDSVSGSHYRWTGLYRLSAGSGVSSQRRHKVGWYHHRRLGGRHGTERGWRSDARGSSGECPQPKPRHIHTQLVSLQRTAGCTSAFEVGVYPRLSE